MSSTCHAGVINLSPEKPRVFAEIARVLRPGGAMLVSDIVATDLPAEIRLSAALYSSCVAGAISEQEYVAGLQNGSDRRNPRRADRLVLKRECWRCLGIAHA